MKLFLVVFVLCCITSQGISQDFIGDVKYSILPPDSFCKYNPQWILMDGGNSIRSNTSFAKSRLHNEFNMEKLPDARGLFIRSMNLGRAKNEGDEDGDSTIGRYQSDTFKKHDHGGGNHVHTWKGNAGGSVTIDNWGTNMVIGGNNSGERSTPSSGKIINPEGGDETRPRNIALYVYIKIN